jgi:hypothetical protein
MPISIDKQLLRFFPEEWMYELSKLMIDYLVFPLDTIFYREVQSRNPQERKSIGYTDLGFVKVTGMEVMSLDKWTVLLYETQPLQVVIGE